MYSSTIFSNLSSCTTSSMIYLAKLYLILSRQVAKSQQKTSYSGMWRRQWFTEVPAVRVFIKGVFFQICSEMHVAMSSLLISSTVLQIKVSARDWRVLSFRDSIWNSFSTLLEAKMSRTIEDDSVSRHPPQIISQTLWHSLYCFMRRGQVTLLVMKPRTRACIFLSLFRVSLLIREEELLLAWTILGYPENGEVLLLLVFRSLEWKQMGVTLLSTMVAPALIKLLTSLLLFGDSYIPLIK